MKQIAPLIYQWSQEDPELGLRSIPVPNDSAPDQVAFRGGSALRNTILAGSAVVGVPAGQLSLWTSL